MRWSEVQGHWQGLGWEWVDVEISHLRWCLNIRSIRWVWQEGHVALGHRQSWCASLSQWLWSLCALNWQCGGPSSPLRACLTARTDRCTVVLCFRLGYRLSLHQLEGSIVLEISVKVCGAICQLLSLDYSLDLLAPPPDLLVQELSPRLCGAEDGRGSSMHLADEVTPQLFSWLVKIDVEQLKGYLELLFVFRQPPPLDVLKSRGSHSRLAVQVELEVEDKWPILRADGVWWDHLGIECELHVAPLDHPIVNLGFMTVANISG